MTSTQTTATGTVPAARRAPDSAGAAALPGTPFQLGATPAVEEGIAGTNFAIASFGWPDPGKSTLRPMSSTTPRSG